MLSTPFSCGSTRAGKEARRRGSVLFPISLFALTCLITWVLIGKPDFSSARNKYQTAQLASVAIDVADGSGSGFVIKRKNAAGKERLFVVTANHVMEPTLTTATVKFYTRADNHQRGGMVALDARLVARLDEIDAAVLLINPGIGRGLFSTIEFTREFARPGDALFTIGSPHKAEHDNVISDGIVSQVGFNFRGQMRGWGFIDQMTAPVNSGNSGGPVFNSDGRVIGLAVGTEGNGINFFVPSRAILAESNRKGLPWITDPRERCPDDAELERRIRDYLYE